MFEAQNIGQRSWIKPNFTEALEHCLVINSNGSTISLNVNCFFRLLDLRNKPRVIEQINSRLVVEQDQISQIHLL